MGNIHKEISQGKLESQSLKVYGYGTVIHDF